MYTIGCDPEIFYEINNEVISAIGMIGGSKIDPLPIDNKGNMVQEDNIAAEFNIPPCTTKESFKKNILICLNYLDNNAKKFNASLSRKASEYVNPMFLKSKKAKEFGCEPDYNVYEKRCNESPTNVKNLRVCGGHIAVGNYDITIENTEKIVKSMDLFLGLQAVLLDNDVDRRKMYGKAGCFRFKDFGLEYRTLSNFWVMSEELIDWAYKNTIKAINFAFTDDFNKITNEDWNQIIIAINNCDKILAEQILEKKLNLQKIK